eukprot:m.252691 g.252691  ORF g.252691 m.252691 type:complete len:503 (+) comp26514_c3_seq18:215-1723(+)
MEPANLAPRVEHLILLPPDVLDSRQHKVHVSALCRVSRRRRGMVVVERDLVDIGRVRLWAEATPDSDIVLAMGFECREKLVHHGLRFNGERMPPPRLWRSVVILGLLQPISPLNVGGGGRCSARHRHIRSHSRRVHLGRLHCSRIHHSRLDCRGVGDDDREGRNIEQRVGVHNLHLDHPAAVCRALGRNHFDCDPRYEQDFVLVGVLREWANPRSTAFTHPANHKEHATREGAVPRLRCRRERSPRHPSPHRVRTSVSANVPTVEHELTVGWHWKRQSLERGRQEAHRMLEALRDGTDVVLPKVVVQLHVQRVRVLEGRPVLLRGDANSDVGDVLCDSLPLIPVNRLPNLMRHLVCEPDTVGDRGIQRRQRCGVRCRIDNHGRHRRRRGRIVIFGVGRHVRLQPLVERHTVVRCDGGTVEQRRTAGLPSGLDELAERLRGRIHAGTWKARDDHLRRCLLDELAESGLTCAVCVGCWITDVCFFDQLQQFGHSTVRSNLPEAA